MPHATIDWSELDRSLQQDTQLSRQLLELLEQERLCLEQRQYEHYEPLLSEKQRLLGALEHGVQARRRWLRGMGFADDAAALRAAEQAGDAVARRWHEAAQCWRECQSANQINEQVCQRTRVVVERVLDLLRGEPGQGATYDARGVPRHQEGGRTITNA